MTLKPRRPSLVSYADRPIPRGVATPDGSGFQFRIILNKDRIDENAAAGTPIGALSVRHGGDLAWNFTLQDSAGGRAQLVGAELRKGATALDRDTQPTFDVAVTAQSGFRVVHGTVTVTVRHPLAALPLPAGSKMPAIGDSQFGYNNYFGSPVGTGNQSGLLAAVSTAYGFIQWAKAVDPRFDFVNWYDTADPLGRNFIPANQGLFSDHLGPRGSFPGIITRIPALLAKRPSLAAFQGSFNTIHSNDDESLGTAEYCISKMEAGLKLFRDAGCHVILVVPYPTKAWPVGDKRYNTLATVQQWHRDQAARDGVGVLDATDILAPGGVVDTTMFKSDFIHLSPKGALRVGTEKFLPIIQAMIAAGSYFDQDPANTNLLTAAQADMIGDAGTMTLGNQYMANNGVAPTGYTVTRNRNCAILNSMDEYAPGKRRLNMRITPYNPDENADAQNYFEMQVTPPTVVVPTGEVGKWYKSWFFIEIDECKDITFIETLYGLYAGTTTAVHRSIGLARESSGDFILGLRPGPLSFWLDGPPVTNGSANATINGERGLLRLTGNRKGSPFNVKISRAIVRQIADPRPNW